MNTTHRIYSLDIIRRQTAPLPWIAILAIMMVRAALGQCVPPPNDLISWWQAEGNADDFVDGNHGLLVHGATFAPGLVHQAFSFDGVDDHVSINDAPNLRPAAFTLVAWIRTTDASFQQPIIAKAQAAGNWVSYMLRIRDGGRLELAVENRSEFRYAHWLSDATLSADTWYHLVGTWANVNGDLTDGRI